MSTDNNAVKTVLEDVKANGLGLQVPRELMNKLVKVDTSDGKPPIDINDFYSIKVTLTPLHSFCEARSYSGEQAKSLLSEVYTYTVIRHIEDNLRSEVFRYASVAQTLSDLLEKSKYQRDIDLEKDMKC
jgi:hypothetical protein